MAGFGGSLLLDGVDDFVDVGSGSSLDLGNTLTVEAWIKPTDLSGRHGVFSTRADNAAGSFQLEIGTAGAHENSVAVTGVGTFVARTGSNVLVPNEWNHIAYTKH